VLKLVHPHLLANIIHTYPHEPGINFFRLRSLQVMTFNEIKILCNDRWKTETSQQKKKWTISFATKTLRASVGALEAD
jgi:hypothetical protein